MDDRNHIAIIADVQQEIRPHRFGGEGVLIGGQQQH